MKACFKNHMNTDSKLLSSNQFKPNRQNVSISEIIFVRIRGC